MLPASSAVTHSWRETHEMSVRRLVSIGSATTAHAPSPPVGFVEVTTPLPLSPTTHRFAAGQEPPRSDSLPPKRLGILIGVAVQAEAPPPGFDEMSTSPPAVATHRPCAEHDMCSIRPSLLT
jgi:hypothetical protein